MVSSGSVDVQVCAESVYYFRNFASDRKLAIACSHFQSLENWKPTTKLPLMSPRLRSPPTAQPLAVDGADTCRLHAGATDATHCGLPDNPHSVIARPWKSGGGRARLLAVFLLSPHAWTVGTLLSGLPPRLPFAAAASLSRFSRRPEILSSVAPCGPPKKMKRQWCAKEAALVEAQAPGLWCAVGFRHA